MALDRVRWDCSPYPYSAAARLEAELGLSPVVAAVLARRGHTDPASARAFLAAADRHDPRLIDGMDAACERILDHVRRGSAIAVHGDYDVDGVCSTAVLVRALRRLGAEPSFHLPSRGEDGYGLSVATVERLAAAGTGLIVTVDCGIGSVAEVARAGELGVEVVVTDHHRPGAELPACPVVHPALGGYPCPELCAAGVVHKLAQALYAAAGEDPRVAEEDLDLVALATVCDVVPLVGENRRLVREGLVALGRTPKPGLRALMRVAGVEPGTLDAGSLGFRLGPRINAAGRLQRADAALELVLTPDERRAAEIADELDLLNRRRQDVETRITFAAEAARAEQDAQAAYVLAGEGWHPGVVGIVASRLVERHHRPCVLIALDEDGGGRGSGRSIPAFDLHAGLASCSGHLRRFGGHRVAAGLEIDAERVHAFRMDFAAHAAARLAPGDLVPVQRVDAVTPAGALGLDLAEELERLAPFGAGNPQPRLLVPGARVGDVRPMGREGAHARFALSSGGARARAVAFRTPPGPLRALGDAPHDVCVRLERNEWNGAVEPRLVLGALRATAGGACRVVGKEPSFWPAALAELDADPAGTHPAALVAVWRGEVQQRDLVDRRGHGIAGVAGDLVSTGEAVLVISADVARRQEGLEAVLGGMGAALRPDAACGLAVADWHALAAEPGLAAEFDHLVALDPPPHPSGQDLLAAAPGGRYAHLAWGEPEAAFALSVTAAELDLRPALAEAYRALRDAGGGAGEALAALLRGNGRYPRSPALCGRLLRVFCELGLVELDTHAVRCHVLPGAGRTELDRSPAYRAYAARLADARAWLERCCVTASPAAARRAA
ncbi:MAG: single-stranded-DNA-specific exonuclease RecJ [Thermoleophilaceae bacterium]